MTNAEVLSLTGEPGDFRATVRQHYSGVLADRCTGCGDCALVCPVTAPNPFDVGLGTRKAIFRPFPQAVPATYAIDPQLCLNKGDWITCERCRAACSRDAIDLERRDRERVFTVGAVIVATGFDEFDPSALRRYGYGIYPNVMTSLELERLLNASGPTLGHVRRPSDGRAPQRIVYVQCVGARGEAGRSYCSRFCCMNAVKDALLLKQHDPQVASVTILYTDLRAFGKGFDEFCQRAHEREWIHFVRGRPAKITEHEASRDLEVQVEDTERGELLRIAADMVVLSCAGQPATGARELAERLGIATDAHGFVAAESALGPVRTSRGGVYVCGSAMGPQVIPECVAQGSAAAAAAAIALRQGRTRPIPVSEGSAVRADAAANAPTETGDSAGGLETVEIDALLAGLHAPPEEARVCSCGVAHEMLDVAETLAAGGWRDRLGGARTAEGAAPASMRPDAPAATQPSGAPAGDQAGAAPAAEAVAFDPLAPPRIGVFLCHCGINIAGVLAMPEILAYAQRLPGVVHAREELFACSASAQEAIRAAIAEHGLNRVVVAACTPRTHEPIFRQNCAAAGLNPYLLEMVNIRDQCSWVHTEAPEAATAKARDLLRMAAARARSLSPLQPTEVEVTRRVLVVGGGLTGMRAASDLSALGFEVILIERAPEVGGLVAELHTLYPDGQRAAEAVEALLGRLRASPVRLELGARVAAVDGFVGNFRVRLERSTGDALDEITAGAIIIAIGAEPYAPERGEFGYGELENVITSVELERRLAAQDDCLAGIGTVAFIQCVGSRTLAAGTAGTRGYSGCSRVCCPTTVKQALELARRGIDPVVLYRDLRMVGAGMEELYREARGRGALFLRVPERRAPRVLSEGGRATAIAAEDSLLRAEVNVPVDLVVLAVGLVPRAEEAQRIQEMLKTPKGADGFFLERHPELGPIETCVDGVFACGAAQGPKELRDALAQASAAAAKAAALLGSGRLFLDPAVCRVNADLCRGCGLCVSLCDFRAPELTTDAAGIAVAAINPALCKGCGTCAVWCPTGAIEAQHFTDTQITDMIDSLFATEASR